MRQLTVADIEQIDLTSYTVLFGLEAALIAAGLDKPVVEVEEMPALELADYLSELTVQLSGVVVSQGTVKDVLNDVEYSFVSPTITSLRRASSSQDSISVADILAAITGESVSLTTEIPLGVAIALLEATVPKAFWGLAMQFIHSLKLQLVMSTSG